jgi:hypothetical protein
VVDKNKYILSFFDSAYLDYYKTSITPEDESAAGQCYSNSHPSTWVACRHGMAGPQVADGGDTLQIWRVTANILNKQKRTGDKG